MYIQFHVIKSSNFIHQKTRLENKVLEIYFRAFSKLDNSRNLPSLFFSFYSKHITNCSFKFFCLFFLFSLTQLYCWVYRSQREALGFLKSFTIRKIIFFTHLYMFDMYQKLCVVLITSIFFHLLVHHHCSISVPFYIIIFSGCIIFYHMDILKFN